MDQLMAFAQDRWYLIAAAIVALFIVVRIVKTVVKWVFVLIIVSVLVLYGANYKDKLQSVGAGVAGQVTAEIKDSAVKALASEAKEAKFKANPDGSFTISSKNLKVEGKAGSSEVQVTFMGQTFTMSVDGAISAFIEQAKKNA